MGQTSSDDIGDGLDFLSKSLSYSRQIHNKGRFTKLFLVLERFCYENLLLSCFLFLQKNGSNNSHGCHITYCFFYNLDASFLSVVVDSGNIPCHFS